VNVVKILLLGNISLDDLINEYCTITRIFDYVYIKEQNLHCKWMKIFSRYTKKTIKL
jgi:hypothetical protein